MAGGRAMTMGFGGYREFTFVAMFCPSRLRPYPPKALRLYSTALVQHLSSLEVPDRSTAARMRLSDASPMLWKSTVIKRQRAPVGCNSKTPLAAAGNRIEPLVPGT